MRARDLGGLPPAVEANARILDNDETMWHVSNVGDAIDALAAAGRVVLGPDIRDYRADSSCVEIAWSAFDPRGDEDDIETCRQAALAALGRPDMPGKRVLVTWR